jgi:rod shape-determining protein MreC
MWRIIRFLGRFGNFLLFLFLELIALAVIVTVNKPQHEISQSLLLEVSGSLAETQQTVYGYFNLVSENEKLKSRDAELESRILLLQDSLNEVFNRVPKSLAYMVIEDSIARDSCALQEFERIELPDSLMPVSRYHFIPAVAINNSVNLNYNYITLNKGSKHGITLDMGVISPEGIAGQVVEVSAHYSLALSVLNKKFRTGAKLLRNSNVGTMRWEGEDASYAWLDFIPQTSLIKEGDTVVSSGYSTVFPGNYMIGTVEKYNTDSQDGFFQIKVKLSTNFRGLHNVYFVQHSHRAEIDSLEQTKHIQ